MLLFSHDDMIMLIQSAEFTSHTFPYAAFLRYCGSSMADLDLRKYPATDIFDAWQNLMSEIPVRFVHLKTSQA